MLIQEVILENFMSYEYTRIPLKQGVNVICGPNGSGKSSLLLGISVALGQSYTERSKKLSELIRWGKEQARVTLVLNNSSDGKKRRPASRYKKDRIYLTRILRKDGKYWFELESRAATKAEVRRLLAKFGVDPDNLLIIMHQNMVEQFAVLSPQEKLVSMEAAVGLEPYRRNILSAQKKLNRILSREKNVENLLESAEQTFNYWREQHGRFQLKKQLVLKRRFLEREFAWAEASKTEKNLFEIRGKIQKARDEILKIEEEEKHLETRVKETKLKISEDKEEWRKLLEDRLLLEQTKAKLEYSISSANQMMKEIHSWEQQSFEEIREYLSSVEQLQNLLNENSNPHVFNDDLKLQFTKVEKASKNLESTWNSHLNIMNESVKKSVEDSANQLREVHNQISDVDEKMVQTDLKIEGTNDQIVDLKISLALLDYRRQNVEKLLNDLGEREVEVTARYSDSVRKAEKTGSQIPTTRDLMEVVDEIRIIDGQLLTFADVSEDVERMYESYSQLFLELKEKARLVAENKEKALREVETRVKTWKQTISSLVENVNINYQKILSKSQALGEIRIIDEDNIETAGLQLLVGFKGARLVPLNSYTQSGGERSTATMSFLLALQQHVRSPFRAVDEYDIHMDPKNREMIVNILISSVNELNAQYLAITPSQITFTEKGMNIITVQNIEGSSVVREIN